MLKTLIADRQSHRLITNSIFLRAWRRSYFLRSGALRQFVHSLLTVSHCWTFDSSANLKLTFSGEAEHIFSSSLGLSWTCFNFNFDFLFLKRSGISINHLVSSKDSLERGFLNLWEFCFCYSRSFHFYLFVKYAVRRLCRLVGLIYNCNYN